MESNFSFFLKWLMSLVVITYCYASTFTPCQYGVKGYSCDMTCETPDLTERIVFTCNGSSRGTCVSSSFCIGSGLQTQLPNTVVLTISSLSYTRDIGEWTCSYNGTDAAPTNFIVYGNSTRRNVTSIPNPSDTKIERVSLSFEADCVYPSNPKLKLSCRQEGSNNYKTLLESQVVGKSAAAGQCNEAVETIISENRVVIGKNYPNQLPGKAVYFKIELYQTPQNAIILATDYGPFTFQDLDVAESGVLLFFCGFSTAIIVFCAALIILILLKCKILGDFTKKKIYVIIAFSLPALIIGVILGSVATSESDKKDVFLGLGLSFGFLCAAALFVTLWWMHANENCDVEKVDNGEKNGTPTSASNVKVTTDRKAFHGNPVTTDGNKVDSQPKDPLRPLPVPPANRGNQLEPIVSLPNDGAISSEKKKKKKKKKRKSDTREESGDQ